MTETAEQLIIEEPLTLHEAQEATRERMHGRIDELVGDDELRQIIYQVGQTREDLTTEQLDELTTYSDIYGLQAATKAVFDLRGNGSHYRERWEAEGTVFEPGLDHAARELAGRLGLVGNTLPKYDRYDVQLNLGGAANSMIYRQTYGSKIVPAIMRAQGRDYHIGMEINLGSTRPVEDDERKRTQPYGQAAYDEFDLGVRAAETVHGLTFEEADLFEGTDPRVIEYVRKHVSAREAGKGVLESEQDRRERYVALGERLMSMADQGSDEAATLRAERDAIVLPQPPNKWRVAITESPEDGHVVAAISAGLQAGVWDANDIRKERPNTADTYVLLEEMLHDHPAGARILVVTSAHFTGFQGADAERLAFKLGADVDVIGFDPTQFGEPSKPTHELLQEIHSKVSSTIGVAKYIGVLPSQPQR
jgi:hypothetical protein